MSTEHESFIEDPNVGNEFLKDAIASLPPQEAHELLSVGVCLRCVFRILGRSCYLNMAIPPMAYVSGLKEPEAALDILRFRVADPQLCPACNGVLQLHYRDTGNNIVKMRSAEELALLVIGLIKNQKHIFDGFSVELSLPHIVSENEQRIRSFIEKKYSSAPWFVRDYASVKEAFKSMITASLEQMQGSEVCPSSLCIRFSYSLSAQISNVAESCLEKTNKILKEESLNCPTNNDISLQFKSIFAEVHEPLTLAISCSRPSVCIVGRYLKFSRNVSQTRWIIDEERVGEASVEELIGSKALLVFNGDAYKFHAAGREDIDVRMLGTGRPFLIEIQNPRQSPSSDRIKEIETTINNSNSLIAVRDLRFVSNEGWAMMKEGETEKQKQYCALVWISRPIEEKDVQTFASFVDMKISQKTPVRVLHRRSPMARDKIIHWMKIELISGNAHYFLLHLCTQAGTYIKEFVHGDLGRTHPSVGSIMGCRAEIVHLDVTDVKMDGFD